MPQYQTWEEFSRAAEKLYLADPMKGNAPTQKRRGPFAAPAEVATSRCLSSFLKGPPEAPVTGIAAFRPRFLFLSGFHLSWCQIHRRFKIAPRQSRKKKKKKKVLARVVLKYRHSDGSLCIKVTDDLVCLVYRTDQAQDVKKIEKFHSQLMRLMVAKESRSVAMETD
uniref:Signal recognition particle 9 n=1 Tax=Canis lupus familiaris TaxID=9615 RepID=A0A8C0MC22_CANLF